MDILSVGELIRLAQVEGRSVKAPAGRDAGVLVCRDDRAGLIFRRQYYPDWAAAVKAGNAMLANKAYRGCSCWVDLPDGSRIDFH